MKVYAFVVYGQDGYAVERVFSTRELADAALEAEAARYDPTARTYLDVLEFEVDAAE